MPILFYELKISPLSSYSKGTIGLDERLELLGTKWNNGAYCTALGSSSLTQGCCALSL